MSKIEQAIKEYRGGSIFPDPSKWKSNRKILAAFKAELVKNDFTDISLKKGHLYLSGFATKKSDGKIIYFSYSVDSSMGDVVLVRTAESYKDYTGGNNHFFSFDEFGKKANNI